MFVNHAVAVASLIGLVKLRQRQESIFVFCRILGGEITKQLLTIVDDAIAVTVQYQECIVRSGCGPGDLQQMTVAANVEHYSIRSRGQMKALAFGVDDDW